MSRGVVKGLGIAVLSSGVASGITWYVTRKIVTEQFEARIDQEIKESVEYILAQTTVNVVVSDEDPDILAEQMNEAEQPLQVDLAPAEPDPAHEPDEEPTVSEVLEEFKGDRVFGSQEEKPPLDELAQRNQAVAYHKISTPEDPTTVVQAEEVEPLPPEPEDPDISVISRDIFNENGSEYEQITLTFFLEDGGVLDAHGDFVEDHSDLIGVNKPRFGELSEDANVVYLRNKRLEQEYEVIADPGRASDFLAHSLQHTFRPSWQQ